MSILMQFDTKAERIIANSFFKLLEKKHFENISVKDITQNVELSRGTFYIYFDNKYDLVEKIEGKVFDRFVSIMKEIRNQGKQDYYSYIEQGFNPLFLKYFDHLEENCYEFKIMFSDNYISGFSNRLSRLIMQERMKTTNTWHNSNISVNNIQPLTRRYREEVLSSLYISLFSTWINNDMDLEKEEIARLLSKMWLPLSKI